MSLYMIKGLIHQYDIKLYIPNIGALKYIKQLLAVIKEKNIHQSNNSRELHTPL